MSAEQQPLSFVREIFHKLHRPVIKGLDAYPLFHSYFCDLAKGIEKEEAHRRFRLMLEANLRSYTQEGIGNQDIQEYGTEVTRARCVPRLQEDSDRIVFRDYKDTDTLRDQREKNREVYKHDPQVIDLFDTELNTWEHLWNKVVLPLDALIGEPNSEIIIRALHTHGFVYRDVSNSTSELCEVSYAIKALFPELGNDQTIEIYEHPEKYVLVSPRNRLHHNGETSIARLTRFVYIPKLNKFAFLERGLFTAYENKDIATFFTLDGKDKPTFKRDEDMLSHIAVLASEFTNLPPHAVFNHIITAIGYFPEIPVGDNVVREKPRSFHTQIAYVEQVLAFEEQLVTENPELLASLKQRLEWVLEPVEHSLLRANTLDVHAQVANYIRVFSNPDAARHPNGAKKSFRLGVLKSYPDFSIRVGSVLDCSTGALLGGVKQAGSLGGLESMIGADATKALYALEGTSVRNRAQFEAYAKALGKDPSLFTRWGTCVYPGCPATKKGLQNYLGDCNCCMACEKKDDLGLHGALPAYESTREVASYEGDDSTRFNSDPIGLGTTLALLTSGKRVLEDM